jgi:hypothetical protein
MTPTVVFHHRLVLSCTSSQMRKISSSTPLGLTFIFVLGQKQYLFKQGLRNSPKQLLRKAAQQLVYKKAFSSQMLYYYISSEKPAVYVY